MALTRLVPLAVLAAGWVLLRALNLASSVSLPVERALGRAFVLLFAGLLLVQGCRATGPRLRASLVRPGGAALFAAATVGYAIAHALLTRMVRFAAAPEVPAYVRLTEGYGPLTVWPALEFWWPGVGLMGSVTLGRAALLGGTAPLLGAAVVLLAARWRAGACPSRREGATLGAAGAAGPLIATACPACGPAFLGLVALAGGATSALPLAQALSNPASPLSTLLEAAGPLALLAAVLHLAGPGVPRGPAGPVFPRRLSAAAVALPLFAASLLQIHPAVAWGFREAAGTVQEMLADLFVAATVGAVFLTLVVFVVLVYFAVRYRYREGEVPPEPHVSRAGRRALTAAFVGVPAVILFAIGMFSHSILMELMEPPEDALEVDVMGMQFGWRFQYPDGTSDLNDLRVQEGEVVMLHVTSTDVVHSFFVPDLGVKIDANPGMVNTYWFEAVEPGTYEAHCAEFCGVGHAGMLATVTVYPAEGEGPRD